MQSLTVPEPIRSMEEEDTERIASSDSRAGLVSIDPQRMSGTPCFAGTRVPVQTLWDHLAEGPSMEEFLDGFPSVSREQATKTLQMALQCLLEGSPAR